jgi:hypothetical protein
MTTPVDVRTVRSISDDELLRRVVRSVVKLAVHKGKPVAQLVRKAKP